MKSFSSILLWLLLVALVAVPSFLFYNWVMQGKEKAAAETASSGPVVNVFPGAQGGSAQPKPEAAAAQPAAAPAQPAPKPAAAQPAAVKPEAEPQQAAAPAQPEQKPSASANAPEQAPAQAQAPAQDQQQAAAQGEQGVEVSTVPKPRSWYAPKADRDPTFSPADYRRIKEEQMQRAEAERLARYAERSKPREPGPETKINLQGIVGNAAIINGDMYSAGQTVRGIKILKVGTDYVICECVTGTCKGKKFKKVLK